MSQEFQDLKAQVDRVVAGEAKAVVTLDKIKAALDIAIASGDANQLTALANQLKTAQDALDADVAKVDPPAPTPAAPVAAPVSAPVVGTVPTPAVSVAPAVTDVPAA